MRSLILICACILVSCKGSRDAGFIPDYQEPYQPVIVYKTKADYSKNVPVLLSDDKTYIVSYPHPNDLRNGDRYAYPTVLNSGYLLDNRGIGKNVAFLKMSYEEYYQLKEAPTLAELYSSIIDKDPLLEMCNCGNKNAFEDTESQLNKLIRKDRLKEVCKKIY